MKICINKNNEGIYGLLSDIKEKRMLLERAYICDNTLPRKEKLYNEALQSQKLYFKQQHKSGE